MVRKLISGGQAGAERAAWDAARRAGIATGGYMGAGFVAEDGPQPRLAALYGAVEFRMDDARRLRANLRHANGLLWFGRVDAPGAREVVAACGEVGVPYLMVQPGVVAADRVVGWLDVFDVATLAVAAEPESAHPGLGRFAADLLARVFAARRLAGPNPRPRTPGERP